MLNRLFVSNTTCVMFRPKLVFLIKPVFELFCLSKRHDFALGVQRFSMKDLVPEKVAAKVPEGQI